MRTWLHLALGFVILLPSSVQAARVIDSTRPLEPIAFERNDGQAASDVLYEARARGVRMALFRDGFDLDIQGERIRVRLPGARPTAVEALEELTSRSHAFVGSDPSRWHTQIRHYGRVRYREVLPGIDLDVYGGAPGLEYDFRIGPAADASAIQIGFEGTRSMKVDAEGALVLEHRGGRLVQPPPLAYQETPRGRRIVACRFVLGSGHSVRFALGAYDRRLPLVIDPVLVLSTYLGGPSSDQPGGIALGPDGSVTIVGWDGLDVVLHRISATGTLMWSTRLGGSGFEAGQDVAVDAQGNVYVTGSTFSPNFPVVGGVPGSTGTAFVTKLAPDGSTLVFSTRLGGSGTSRGNGIGVDASGGVVIAGFTTSTDFPVTAGAAQATPGGGVDCFVARLSPSGSQLVFATYLGGSGDDGYNFRQLNMLAVDAAGDAWAIGETRSTDFPTTPGAFQRNFGGGFLDAFVTRFSPTGSVQWSTYLGGSGEDAAFGIALGNDASAYVVGYTASVNFPVTPGAFDTVPAPCCFGDGFLVRLDSSGSQLAFGTFLGGTSATGLSVDVDSRGRAYVTGRAPFFDLPLVDPVQTTCASCTSGFSDAFAMTVAPPGSSLLFSTYLGGTGQDQGNATVADGSGFWVTGEAGASWPVTPGALQPFSGGGQDGFLVRLQFAAYTTHVILDVSGYFVASGDFFSLTPCRVVDTRLPAGVRGGPALTTWNDRSFPLVGGCGVPPEATAIAANIAVVPGAAGGHLRIFPAGSPVPLTAAITYNAGQTRSNNAILPLGADGITVRSVESP